jgi:SAM-dependent methyltransferase
MPDLTVRRLEPEWMDDPGVDPAALADALAFIRRINVALGYTRATVSHLRRFSHSWSKGTPITLLDVATGTADVPRAVLRWADRAGHDVRLVGLDLHAATLAVATADNPDPRLTFVRGDALALPFADRSVDYVLCGMFLHHLPEPAVVAALREMDRVARRGVVVGDLLRTRRAYAWITLFTLAASDMVRHDARGSVAAAFTPAELTALRDQAGLTYATPTRHFGHRLVLAGERPHAWPRLSGRE